MSDKKLAIKEKRARDFLTAMLDAKNNPSDSLHFTMHWKKSRTWGRNPQIYDRHGNPMCDISGCGYCKKSAALAAFLRFLPGLTEEGVTDIRKTGGAGVGSVQRACDKHGWKLTSVGGDKISDCYKIERITKE